MEVMRNHLKLIKWFCLTSDGWKDIMNQNSYLGLTIHYFDDYELQSFCLSVEVFNESMTSEAIFKRIEHVLNEWEIPMEKIVSIVTDGAANFQSAARRFGNNLHCCAHRLNLVVEDSLESELHVVNLITSVRNIVTLFKQSSKLMNELRDERQLAGKSDLKLLQDIATRWNSVYIMIERYLELRNEISVVLLKNMRREEDIEYNQINELKEIIILLEPFYEMTLDLSGEKYVSISKIIPLIVSINTYLSKTRVECASTRSLKLNLLKNVKQRFNSVESDEALAFGTLLDPRFKKLAFQFSSAESIAVTKLNSLLYNIPTTQIVPCDDESDSLLWSIYDRKVRSLNDVSCGLNSGLKHYLELPVIDRHNDPMQFWKKYKENWPQLHNLALKYLTMQATSVPCERLFSKTGSLITEKRNRLKPKNVKLISFLDSLPDIYI